MTKNELEKAQESANRVVEIHQRLSQWLRIGVKLPQIDIFVRHQLEDLSSKSCFRGYRTRNVKPVFPSYSCLSINDCIVHGTAGSYSEPVKKGDVLSIDIGVSYQGFIGDAAWTYVFGEPSKTVSKLTSCAKDAILSGIYMMTPESPFKNWSQTVQQTVENAGFHCVEGLGGHGYGQKLHMDPFLPNMVTGTCLDDTKFKKGMLLAVEPMICVGTGKIRHNKSEWPIYTADGSLAVHYEHDVYIDEDGPVILTEGLNNISDLILV